MPASDGKGGTDEAADPVVGEISRKLDILDTLDEPARSLLGEAVTYGAGRKRSCCIPCGKGTGGRKCHGMHLEVSGAVPPAGKICQKRRREALGECSCTVEKHKAKQG